MFVEAWRLERDYFYDRNLHNVDYQGLLERNRPFVDRVSDRLSSMISWPTSSASSRPCTRSSAAAT